MSTFRQRKAFLMSVMAARLREVSEKEFHKVELPFHPRRPSDRQLLVAEAQKMADELQRQAERIYPQLDPELKYE